MNIDKYKKMVYETVIEPMIEFSKEGEDFDYIKEYINRCEKLLLIYLEALEDIVIPTDEAIMKQVEILVLALNELDEETEGALIETVEREAIWEIIQNSAIECGLQDVSDDITEEWREW